VTRAGLLLLLVACGARDHHVYRLPSACRDAEDAEEAERCGAWLLDEMMTATLGVYEDPALERYVRRVGRRVAAQSGRDDVDWTFRILDDPGAQAWAAPGGHVYVTRGLLALLDSEAELAAVLSHEVAHVAAGHTEELLHRLPEPSTMSLDLHTLFQLARDDEAQADQLGVRYAAAAGYDPTALQRALIALHQPGLGHGSPSWVDRHPPLEVRLAMTARVAGRGADGRHGRRRYLQEVAGLVVGEDPRHGLVSEGRFVHAAAGLSFAMPEGWEHDEPWEPGRLSTRWFRAWRSDERLSLIFFPMTRASVLERVMLSELERASTREVTLAGYRGREGRLRADETEEIDLSGVTDVHLLVLRGRGGQSYGLMVAAKGDEGGEPLDAEPLYRQVTESFRRERGAPLRVRRLRPRRLERSRSLGELIAEGCARNEERELLTMMNELEPSEPIAPERTIKCLAP
jgi:predicted Zn-dependent protease